MYPSTAPATLRPDLAGSMAEFDLDLSINQMVGLQVAPAINVATKSGIMGILPIEELLKPRNTKRSPGSGYSRQQGKFETVSFACQNHGTEEPIDDEERAMYQDFFDAELVATMRARHAVMTAFERRISTLAHAISTTSAAGTAWSTPGSATPIANVRTAALAIWARIGRMPNTVIMTPDRFEYCRDCAEIVDRVKYSFGGSLPTKDAMTKAVIAQALGVENVLVAGGMYMTTDEGASTQTPGTDWTQSEVIVCVTARTIDPREVCWARTFHWSATGSQIGGAVFTYRDETVESDIVRVKFHTAEVVMYASAAQRITGA